MEANHTGTHDSKCGVTRPRKEAAHINYRTLN